MCKTIRPAPLLAIVLVLVGEGTVAGTVVDARTAWPVAVAPQFSMPPRAPAIAETSGGGEPGTGNREPGTISTRAAAITGKVTDAESGQALVGVEVFLDGTSWRGVSDQDGQYRIADVQPGSYTLRAQRLGYNELSQPVTVPDAGEVTVDFTLEVAALGGLEEIVVTATKRAENITDAPLSITAIGNAEIESRGLKGMGDYLSAVPGVSLIEVSSTSNAVVMRGIDTGPVDQNFGAGTTVASYFGETPITTSAGLLGGSGVDVKLVDIERIEILRGPQGTAFGNSSLGGAVRTIPVAPKLDRFEGRVAAKYSGTGGDGDANTMVQGIANAPLIRDRLALRAVGFRYENSGYYSNVAGSNPGLQEYADSLGPQAVSLARDSDHRGQDVQLGGRLALLLQATDDLSITLSYLYQSIEQDGASFATGIGGRYNYRSFHVLPSRGFRADTDISFDNRLEIANLTVEHGLAWGDVVGSASWSDSETRRAAGAFLLEPWDFVARSPHEGFAGEIRLVSRLGGPLQFLAGVYHENLDDFSSEYYSSLEVPARNPVGDSINEVLGIFENSRELKQSAIFGELSYDLTEQLTLSVGGRFYRYDRDNRLETSGWFTGTPLDAPEVSQFDLDQSGESFKANLSYRPTAAAHLYASWSQGFRLGRPAAGLIPAICDTDGNGFVDGTDVSIASTRVIDSDMLDNYELGGKFRWLDGRLALDASVYRIEWTGLPTNARAECGEATYFYVANAGEATSRGLEIQSNYYLTSAFRIDFNGSYTDAELSVDVPTLDAVAGDRLPGSPKWIAKLGAQYDFIMADYPMFVRADSHYRGSFFGDLAQSPLTESGGYTRVDARLGAAVNDLDVELFVNNLTNVDDYVWRGLNNTEEGFGYIMRPRTIGLQLGYGF